MRRKSPQQKKRESYLKDRRNVYGENSKSSRRGVRLRKRAAARTRRHGASAVLTGVSGTLGEHGADAIESRVREQPEGGWRKYPDLPLGEFVIGRLSRRVRRTIVAREGAAARIKKIRATTSRGNRSKPDRKALGSIE